jgi:hypothetical protein
MGRWMRRHGIRPGRSKIGIREEVWEITARHIGEDPVLYLEFGVFEGEATQWWAKRLTHPQTVLRGFDSFVGLPEDWRKDRPKGSFDVSGRIPQIGDPRVTFIKGWFNETLPFYKLPEHERLFINIDVDLYSSTKYVLEYLKPHIQPGTIIYFDEFSNRHHEFRAFDEFLDSTGWKIRLIDSDPVLYAAAFEFV